MKVISTCKCRVCCRSFRSLNRGIPSNSLATDTYRAAPAPSTQRVPRSPPAASTSKIPYSTSLALALPNELLLDIFRLARPSNVQQYRGWYAGLASVHSRWKEAAEDCLARIAVIRHEDQLAQLDEAIRDGTIGGPVEELVLDIRTTEGGKTTTGRSLDSSLTKLLDSTKRTLKVIRLHGFGINLLSTMPIPLARSLSSVETLEHSPVDSAFALDSLSLYNILHEMRSLRTVAIQPRSQSIGSLEDVPSALVNPLLPRIIDALPVIAALERLVKHDHKYAKDLSDLLSILSNLRMIVDSRAAHVKSLSLSTLSFSPLFFLTLTINSLETLTSLSLTSILIVGDGVAGYPEFFSLLSLLFAKQLEEFTWKDPVLNVIGIDTSLVPAEAFWDFLGRCVKLRTLSLLSPLVFATVPRANSATPVPSPPLGTTTTPLPTLPRSTKPARSRFALPPNLRELSVGSIGKEVKEVELNFWLDRVENLVKGSAPDPNATETADVDGTGVTSNAEADGDDADDDFYTSLHSLFSVTAAREVPTTSTMPPRSAGPSAFESLSISLPASSRTLLSSRTVRHRLSELRCANTADGDGESRDSDSTAQGNMGARRKKGKKKSGQAVEGTIAIQFTFTCLITMDELELTRDMRMDL
ncbi:hypothetical protein JCM11491_006721 [Sporobolomyces phaffii]